LFHGNVIFFIFALYDIKILIPYTFLNSCHQCQHHKKTNTSFKKKNEKTQAHFRQESSQRLNTNNKLITNNRTKNTVEQINKCYKVIKCIKTLHMSTLHPSLRKLNIYFSSYYSYKSDLVKSSERFSLFCCLIYMNNVPRWSHGIYVPGCTF